MAMAKDAEGVEGRVYRRTLFFIGGFDPRGPRAIHRIWTEQAGPQAQVSGGTITVSGLTSLDDLRASCLIAVSRHGARSCTEVVQLRWDDLVRQWWRRGPWSLMASIPVWFWRLLRRGLYGLTRRQARPMFLSLILPPMVLAVMAATGLMLAALAGLAHPLVGLGVLGLMLGIAPLVWRWLDRRVGLSWLTQCLHYMGFGGARNLPERTERAERFARDLIEVLDRADVDEVAVLGFSLGANEAVRVVGLALEQRPDLGQGRVPLSVILMGQLCGPYGLGGGDEGFSQARHRLAEARAIRLINVTSASDPASGCTISPLHGMEGAFPDRVTDCRPRFHKLLTPERFAAIRRDPLAFHFQYLHATDVAGDYDFFGLTCGPSPLSQTRAA